MQQHQNITENVKTYISSQSRSLLK